MFGKLLKAQWRTNRRVLLTLCAVILISGILLGLLAFTILLGIGLFAAAWRMQQQVFKCPFPTRTGQRLFDCLHAFIVNLSGANIDNASSMRSVVVVQLTEHVSGVGQAGGQQCCHIFRHTVDLLINIRVQNVTNRS